MACDKLNYVYKKPYEALEGLNRGSWAWRDLQVNDFDVERETTNKFRMKI